MLDLNPLQLREKLEVLNSLPQPPAACCARVGFMTSLFYPFQCGYFLFHSTCRSCSAHFWISFRGICSACSCRFGVSMEEVNSGASHISILDQNPASYFLKVQQSLELWKCLINCKGPSRREFPGSGMWISQCWFASFLSMYIGVAGICLLTTVLYKHKLFSPALTILTAKCGYSVFVFPSYLRKKHSHFSQGEWIFGGKHGW